MQNGIQWAEFKGLEEVRGEKLKHEGKAQRNLEMERNGTGKMRVDKGLF